MTDARVFPFPVPMMPSNVKPWARYILGVHGVSAVLCAWDGDEFWAVRSGQVEHIADMSRIPIANSDVDIDSTIEEICELMKTGRFILCNGLDALADELLTLRRGDDPGDLVLASMRAFAMRKCGRVLGDVFDPQRAA
jgi:hypothetical protein